MASNGDMTGRSCYLMESNDPYIRRVNRLWDAHDNCGNSAMRNEWKAKLSELDRLHAKRFLNGEPE